MTWQIVTASGGGGTIIGNVTPAVCQGRLTLTTGVSVTTADVTGGTVLYWAPYKGNRIGLYDGAGTWTVYAATEKSLSLGALSNATPYDIFMYDNSGTPTLEALAWTNGTTRATALTTQDGILVKTGATTRRYLGTIYTSAAGQCEDSLTKRFVWNYYNRARRPFRKREATGSWTYTAASYRYWNNSSANKVELVIGVSEDPAYLQFVGNGKHSSNAGYAAICAIGLDRTNADDSSVMSGAGITDGGGAIAAAVFNEFLAVGYHYLALLEYGGAATATFFGTNWGNQGATGWVLG
jgi:hypothetical protein